MNNQRADAGFTLVEALVSLFVFSLVAAGAVTLLAQTIRSHEQSASAHHDLRELQSVRALLFADLAQYVERPVRETDNRLRPQFVGGDVATQLSFVRALGEPGEAGLPRTSLALVEYAFENRALVRRTRVLLDPAQVEGEIVERIVIADAGEPRFEFFDGEIWRAAWIARAPGAAPPRAVALVFQSPRYGEVRIEALVGTGA